MNTPRTALPDPTAVPDPAVVHERAPRFDRHPLDPIALVGGILTIVGGIVGLLHQTGVIRLGPAPTILLVLVAAGLGAAALIVLPRRAPTAAAPPPATAPASTPPASTSPVSLRPDPGSESVSER